MPSATTAANSSSIATAWRPTAATPCPPRRRAWRCAPRATCSSTSVRARCARVGPMAREPHHHAVFLYAECFRRRAYGRNHPLAIPRVALTLDLVRAYGALTPAEQIEARIATEDELLGFH